MPASCVGEVFGQRLGIAVKKARTSRSSGAWNGRNMPHMAAAAHAILERVPLVDLIIEVRDARIPMSSASQLMQEGISGHKRILLLNKADLANKTQTEKWIKHFKEKNYTCCAVNSHKKANVKELLNFLRTRIWDLIGEDSNYTATLMMIGIPNVGKSALVNSMHQTGRISAIEKGKLKYAAVSSTPMETKDISSYKIASCPNIYVLDTPGILLGKVDDAKTAAKIALTGAIEDCLVGEIALAHYFLSILNSSQEYQSSLCPKVNNEPSSLSKDSILITDSAQRRQHSSDYTQDFIVRDVRQALFEVISSFQGNLQDEFGMSRLIELEFAALHEVFKVPSSEATEDSTIAKKLLNLFRTGRLGRYTLDDVPND